jgi:hypothetical protein
VAEDFDAIMDRVLDTRNNWFQDFAALVRLGQFVIEHYDELRRWIASVK